ncbi:LamG domain-containing protein [Actinokineospora sp. NPDC004072]
MGPVDTTLERRADGSVAPVAADGELVLSGGGDGPLAELGSAGRRFSVGWPGALPRPVVAGSTATYPDVLPGVDLQMHAEPGGYRQHLVVKTREAAKNPKLAAIRLSLDTDGLRVRAEKSGALTAVDDAGEVVFSSPPATMWDAERRTKRVGVVLGKGTMDLKPDTAFLADPATRFPVTIDPDWAGGKHGWTSVLSGKPGTAYWNTSGDGPDSAQVGQCYENGYCKGIGEAWSYFQWDTSFLNGRELHGATFNTSIKYSPNCDTRTHEFYTAHGDIWNGVTWSSKPGGTRRHEYAAAGASSFGGCGTGWKPVGLGVPVGDIDKTGFSTFLIKAQSPTDQIAWRKYDPGSTTLSITHNLAPSTPTDLHTTPALPDPCRWCDGKSYYGGDSIQLNARLADPDHTPVNAQWRVFRNGDEDVIPWGNGFKPSGELHDHPLPLGAENGKTISWGVMGGDGLSASPWADHPRAFVVDRVGIDVQPGVASKTYLEDNRWHGGVGVKDVFTFSANDNPAVTVSDIDHYLYGWQYPPTEKVDATALGGPASVSTAPPGDGPQTLYVRSVDRAGHESPTRAYRVYVRAGNGALAQYSFEGKADDTAFLGDRHGALVGGAGYTADGAVGSAVALSGGGHVTAPAAVRTDGSFSVAAWVKATEAPGPSAVMSALSQDGQSVSGYMVGYRGSGHWEIYSPVADQPGTNDEVLRFQRPLALGAWTHVAAVFDQQAGTMKLYLDGELVGTAPRTRGFNAAGPFAVGRSKWAGSPGNHWTGAVDEVQVYDRVLGPEEIAAAVSTSGVQLAHWKLDEKAGATARNSVGGGADAVLENGAEFTAEGAVQGGVRLDGVNDVVSTGVPVVRTDQSFTVSAQVKPDNYNGTYTVLSQDGESFCGFCLQLQDGRWTFVFADADAASPAAYHFVRTPAVTKSGFTHLVGTYDAVTGKIRLYVDGEQAGESSRPVAWNAQRAFRIGAARIGGVVKQHLPGTVDEVRVLSRAITLDEVRGLLSRDNVTAGRWALDGSAAEAGGRAQLNGTEHGGVDWTAGQADLPDPDDLAARFTGPAHITAPSPIDTGQSYAVAAWVRLDRAPTANATAVSLDGQTTSAFVLRALAGGKWSFRANADDTATPTGGEAVSATAAQPGVWTHLVAVHRKDKGRVELYVNGVLAGSVAYTAGFSAAGPLRIGQGRHAGAAVDPFPGAVDDLVLYSRPLYEAEIKAMAGRDLSLGHNWTLDEGAGATSGDAAGARPAALSGGARFTEGRVGGAVRLDGVDDVVSAPAVDVRTDASFTVSAWVRLDGNDCDLDVQSRCLLSAVSLDGATGSKFRLGHVVDDQDHGDGNWVFELPEPDGTVTEAAIAVRPGDIGSWVHLTGVYDKGARAIWLYVDGSYKDDGTLLAPWHGEGQLRIGRGLHGGEPDGHWRGSVDDVRLYSGALDDARVSALYGSYPAPQEAVERPVADAGHWKLNESAGATAADSSGLGRTITLHGGSSWSGGRETRAVQFDGAGGHGETAAPVLDTTGSFSVSAWVALTSGANYSAVLGQDGGTMSTFYLQHDATAKKWGAVVPESDAPNPVLNQVLSVEPALVNVWTHLAVVYHEPRKQLRLYVNGSLSGVREGIAPKPSSGPLSIGRCKYNGAKACYFPGMVDDVRAFDGALSDAEVRMVHDDVPEVPHGTWRFDDGTVADSSWRANPTTATGPVTYPQGLSGTGLGLDGVSASAAATHAGIPMRDSFTVTAWAKLGRGDKHAVVVGQDGARQSGFTIQYRPEVNRWSFGAATHDADNAPGVYAHSTTPPTLNRWTHLAGVYDQPTRQLRLYVDGHHVGTRDNVLLWQANGGFTIGRGKVNGAAAGFFPGVLDEVTTDLGVMPEGDIAELAAHSTPSGGHFGRFIDAQGDHRSANATSGFWDRFDPLPERYRYEGPFGMMLPAQAPGTHRLYSCQSGSDAFTSADAACEGATKLADLGWVYTAPPQGVSTVPLHACRFGTERADSVDPGCEGAGPSAGVLGHLLAYAPLVRYLDQRRADHAATTGVLPPGYHREGTLGLLARSPDEPGIQRLQLCRSGNDLSLSTDPACEGRTVVKVLGGIWTEPPAQAPSKALYQCRLGATNHFASTNPTCEGQTVVSRLGYVLTAVPTG